MAIQQYIIGRDADCTIRIEDESMQVSRFHATLTVDSNKQIYVTDHSSNGTFVNGVRIPSGSKYPVKRGDNISFANVACLDWGAIPKGGNAGVVIIIVAIVILIAGGIGAYFYFGSQKDKAEETQETTIIQPTGTDIQRQIEVQQRDSISRHKLELDAASRRDKLETEEAQKRAEIRRAEQEKQELEARLEAEAMAAAERRVEEILEAERKAREEAERKVEQIQEAAAAQAEAAGQNN